MNSRKPWTDRMLKLLEEGTPVPYHRLMLEAEGLVPPGVAWRWRERRRAWIANYKGAPLYDDEPSEVALRNGRRGVVRQSLASLAHHGRVVFENDGGTRVVRLARGPIVATTEEHRKRSLSIARKRDPGYIGRNEAMEILGMEITSTNCSRMRNIPRDKLPYKLMTIGNKTYRRYLREDVERYAGR